jgi:hypothetical protein
MESIKMLSNIKRRISFVFVLLTVLALMFESTAWAQPKTQPPSLERPMGIPASITDDISLDQLMAKRASVDSAADLDITNKKTF